MCPTPCLQLPDQWLLLDPDWDRGNTVLTTVFSPHRMVYEFLSTFITSGMHFLLNQQVWAVAGLGDSGGDLSFKDPDSGAHLSDLPSDLPCRDGVAQLPSGHCAW